MDKLFLTEKEAAKRYNYSTSWFRNQRYLNKPPPYIKKMGKILYPTKEVDEWFQKDIIK